MDGRERLRLYLEQRRELGESEFVLDSMPLDDVLRLIGDNSPAAPRPSAAGPRPVADARTTRPEAPAEGGSWKDALTAIGADAPARGATVRGAPPAAAPVQSAAEVSAAAQPPATVSTDAGQGIVVGSPRRELQQGPLAALDSLDAVAAHIAACSGCALAKTAKNHVPGEGSPKAQFVVVGEAPGEKEDELGRPFVGRSGDLLTKILEAVQLKREDVFICNVLKHRPPGNRNPSADEIRACSPYLLRQLELLQPRVILALGTFAAQTLLQSTLPIGKLRGPVHRFHGVPLIVTYHPAALLRNPAYKRPTWEDVQLARRIFDSANQA